MTCFARSAAVGFAATIAVMLAGCGGGSQSATPAAPATASEGKQLTQNVTFTPTPSPSPSPSPSPTPSPTLYVSGIDRVNAFPLTASGNMLPSRTIFPHPNQTDGITGIATATDFTLDILQDYRNPSNAPDCRVVQEYPNTNGVGPKKNQLECNTNAIPSTIPAVRGRGIARGTSGEIDILDTLSPQGGPQTGDYVQRTNFSAAPPYNTGYIGVLPGAAGTHHGIAEGVGGHIFISSSSAGDPIVYAGSSSTTGCSASATGAATIDNYSPGAVNPSGPLHTFTIVGRTAAGAVALGPDNATLYVATCDLNGFLFVDAVSTPGAAGPIHPTQSIGPFTNNNVTALAVDAASNLYVGLTANDGSGTNHVRVYAKNAGSGKPPVLRILQNPIPAGSNQKITGLAISPGS